MRRGLDTETLGLPTSDSAVDTDRASASDRIVPALPLFLSDRVDLGFDLIDRIVPDAVHCVQLRVVADRCDDELAVDHDELVRTLLVAPLDFVAFFGEGAEDSERPDVLRVHQNGAFHLSSPCNVRKPSDMEPQRLRGGQAFSLDSGRSNFFSLEQTSIP